MRPNGDGLPGLNVTDRFVPARPLKFMSLRFLHQPVRRKPSSIWVRCATWLTDRHRVPCPGPPLHRLRLLATMGVPALVVPSNRNAHAHECSDLGCRERVGAHAQRGAPVRHEPVFLGRVRFAPSGELSTHRERRWHGVLPDGVVFGTVEDLVYELGGEEIPQEGTGVVNVLSGRMRTSLRVDVCKYIVCPRMDAQYFRGYEIDARLGADSQGASGA